MLNGFGFIKEIFIYVQKGRTDAFTFGLRRFNGEVLKILGASILIFPPKEKRDFNVEDAPLPIFPII